MKLRNIITSLTFVLATTIVVSAQIGYGPNIGVIGGGGGGGSAPSAGTCAAGSVMTSVNIGSAPTCVTTVTPGTITASAPFTFSQTWNNAAVTFQGFVVKVTNTAAGASSQVFKVFGGAAGTSGLICAGPCSGDSSFILMNQASGQIIANTEILVHDNIHIDTNRQFGWNGGTAPTMNNPTGSEWRVQDNSSVGAGYEISLGAAPTFTGAGATPTISGTNAVGRVTLGAAPSATTLVVTFSATLPVAPHCDAGNEGHPATPITVTATSTTAVTLTGTYVAGDAISWHCITWRP